MNVVRTNRQEGKQVASVSLTVQTKYKMKNFLSGVVVSLAMVGMFGGVSFAVEAPAAKPAVETKAAEAPKAAKVEKKKAVKKAVKKVETKKAEKKEAAAPATK